MILRVIAAAALVTAVVYLVTPLTAAGQEGAPTGFFTNTRYLVPGLVLAMVLLPIARPLRAPDRRAWQTLLFLVGVYAITVLATPRWYPGFIVGTIFITLALVWAPAALGLGRVRGQVSRGMVALIGGAVLLLAVVLGRAQEVQYADHHYTKSTLFLQEGGPQKAYDFARRQRGKKIGIAGSSEIIFGQYGFYGGHLDNEVQYVGVKGPDGTYRLATSCRQFRRAINEGDYDYLILSQYTQDVGPYNSGVPNPYQFPVYAWVKNDPALKLVIEEPDIVPEPDYVFKVNGRLDPAACLPEKGEG